MISPIQKIHSFGDIREYEKRFVVQGCSMNFAERLELSVSVGLLTNGKTERLTLTKGSKM